MRALFIGAVVAGLFLVGCARSGVVDSALHGDLAALKRDVKAAQDRGELDRGTVTELARAIARREVRSASGDAAVERIRDVRVCARPLLDVLEDRAERADDAAAEATLTLFDLGKRDAGDMVAKYRDASGGAWRAVAARAASGSKYGPLRRKYFVDPDERVRRAALRAAIDKSSKDDLDPLLEAARLDPDSLSRSLATRAVGAVGGDRAVLALRDHWARADEPTRITIVDAWSMPATFNNGGEHELVTVAETKSGPVAISAADALARIHGASQATGVAVLIRAVKEGTEAERRLAIQLVPLDDADARGAVESATKDTDKEVRVMALARLAGDPKAKKTALDGLRDLAKSDDDIGLQARAALAAAGDRGVKKQLVGLLVAEKARTRTVAAKGLLDLGEYPSAATALADDDPQVRTAVACAVLVHR
jgi:HEAT repeat protein